MGQRQSSEPQDNQDTNRRGRVLRPNSRIEVQRNDPLRRPNTSDNESRSRLSSNDSIPTMAFIPVNENQRRDERRRRREFLREHPGERETADAMNSAATALGNDTTDTSQNRTTTTTATMTTTEGATISPFSRMIAQVISQAVVTSFRNGQIPALNNEEQQQSNVRQQLTMHLSSELFRQMEPENNEDMFIRFIRLPVLVTRIESPNSATDESQHEAQSQQSQQGQTETQQQQQQPSSQEPRPATASATTNTTTTITDAIAEEDSEVTRIIMLPVFLYGLRSTPPPHVNTPETTTTEANTNSQEQQNTSSQEQPSQANASSQEQTTTQEETGEGQSTNRHWTIYVIGGNHVENIMSESPSYEELLNLATLIGSVRQPTVSQEAIDNHLTIDKYTAQVKQAIVGNSEKCQVCLNDYQLEEDVRVLSCHHGFHKDCIDQWLTQGQNKCPLCRKEAVPTTE